MVEITNASTLMPASITVVDDGSTITITTTPLDVTVATGTLTIQTGGITSVNGDAGPVVVLDTDDISEGVVNQYYTDARVDTYLQSGGVSSINFGNDTSLSWNSDDGTLEFPVNEAVTLQIGQENLVHVKNLSGQTLTNGTVVAVTGASGSKLTVDLADYTDEYLSSATIAVMTQALNNNSVGYATTSGLVRGLDTSSFTEGDTLWLDGNGTFVSTKPLTPLHLVQVGWVVRSHPTEGTIFVYIKNGWELEELHDVLITTATDGDFLQWNATGSYWENTAPTTDDISEGVVNEYFTTARARSSISATGDIAYNSNTGVISYTAPAAPVTSVNTQTGAVVLTTSDIAEGTNQYYTDAKVQTVINTNTAGFITSAALSPYYTSAQVDALPVSTFTNDAGYLTSETDSQTLSFTSPNLTISNGNTVDLSALTPTTVDWSTVTNTPTTIAGYGITDLDTSVGAAGYLKTVAADSTPSLGGILDTSDYAIRGTTIPIELQNGVLITEDSAGDYALNIDHTNTTGRGIQVRQGISGTPHTSGQLMRLRSADAIGFAERFKVDYDGSVKINNAYTFPLSDGSASQVLTTDGFGNLSFATPAPGYSDSDVDTHLNTSTATTGQVLSWTGTDYDWITGGGGGSFTGDLLGNSLTDSTQAVTISSLKGGLSHTSLTGQSIVTNTSIDLASGSDLNVDVKNGYIRLTGDITNGTGATFDRSYHIFDTQGYNYNASDRITGFRVDVRHGNSDFATNGQGNIKEIFGSIYDLMRNYNGSSDNTIENIVGMRQRIRANFDTTNLNSVEGIQLQFDSGLSNSTTLKSITTNNADAVMSHWGPIEVGAGGEIVVGDGNNASIKIANKLNQTAAMVQKNVNNNPNFNPIEKVAIDQNITDSTYVVNETERGYFTSHSTRATVTDKFQAPTASSTTTPQVGYGQELTRPVYNTNSAVTSTISDTLYSFSRFGSSGFWLSNGNINVPARQSISFGFPIQFQQGFDNPFVGATGGTAVNNLLTETGQMPTRVVFSYNTGSVANFDAISDTAWTNTEMGTLNSVYDKIWSFGCSFRIQLESSIPSNAANATVVVNKALPPSGVIAAFPGDPNGFVPLYANVPSWMNTSTRALTMTRPATGKTFYRWTIEFSDSTIFAKDFEEFNLS